VVTPLTTRTTFTPALQRTPCTPPLLSVVIGFRGSSRADSTHTSPTAVALFDKILRERLLLFISRELPKLEDYVWSRSADGPNTSTPLNKHTATKLSSLPFRYARTT
jgi:hypothetical protein